MYFKGLKMTSNNQDFISVNKHICLKTATKNYATELFNIINFNRDYFSQFMAWPNFVINEVDTTNFLNDCFVKHRQDQAKIYVILLEGIPVGLLSFNQIDKANKTAYIGYWLDSRAQGKGIMTQAIQALTQFYAQERIIKRFIIKCSVANLKSNQVAKRCGFSYEGRLKQAEYLNGIFHDQNIYSLVSNYI